MRKEIQKIRFGYFFEGDVLPSLFAKSDTYFRPPAGVTLLAFSRGRFVFMGIGKGRIMWQFDSTRESDLYLPQVNSVRVALVLSAMASTCCSIHATALANGKICLLTNISVSLGATRGCQ